MSKVNIKRETHRIDASTDTLGRLATKIAQLLRGKHKATYSPSVDNGDFVIVENIKDLKVTGKKMEQKNYYRHTGYLGGLKTRTMQQLYDESPEQILKFAVYGMLPKNKLRDVVIKRLQIK